MLQSINQRLCKYTKKLENLRNTYKKNDRKRQHE